MLVWLAIGPAAASITELEVRVEQIDAKPQIHVAITGDPCPEDALKVTLDGRTLQPVGVPTTCDTQTRLGKSWWQLAFTGAPPSEGQHTVEVAVEGGETLRASFTVGPRPKVAVPKSVSRAPILVRSEGERVRGQIALKPPEDCPTLYKAPLTGMGPEYPATFVVRTSCEGRGELSARLSKDLALTCGPAVACSGSVVWGWSLGEVAFSLQEGAAAP